MNADDDLELFGKPNDEIDETNEADENLENSQTIISPLKAIRAKCLDCCCWQRSEVAMCTCTNCPLYNFRFGKNPHSKRILTDEQRKKIAERFKEHPPERIKKKQEQK